MKKQEEILNELNNKESKFLYKCPSIQADAYIPICLDYIEKKFDEELKSIKPIKREKSYNNWNKHKDLEGQNAESNRGEEQWVLSLFEEALNIKLKTKYFGTLLDYQVPLKNTKEDIGYGKIDFVSKDDLKKEFYINEVKAVYNGESILRPILEILTYSKQFDKDKMLKDFNCEGYEIKPRIIIFKNTMAARELRGELQNGCTGRINKLIEKYNIDVIILEQKLSYKKVN